MKESLHLHHTYTYGTGFTFPTGVTAPTGRTFDHWEIGGVTVTEIKNTDYGDKTIKAVYTKNTYNITWDLTDGNTSDTGTWAYGIAGEATYTYGTGLASFRDNITAPNGRTFSHWEIGGERATEISASETGDKTIKAIYTKNTYNITWDLRDENTSDTGTWNEGIIASTSYTYGTAYTLPTGLTGPNGRTFDCWEIDGVRATEISDTDFGDKTIKAVYIKNTYNITWDLKDGNTSDAGTWNEGIIASTSYTYGKAYTFPTGVTGPNGRTFDHWEIAGVRATQISATETGDKTIKAVYTKNTYNITWDLRDGNTTTIGLWDNSNGGPGESTYIYGTEYVFPTNVIGPTGRVFDYWTINDVKTTKITATDFGNKTIKAVYKNEEYAITWDLKDTDGREGSWSIGVVASASYIYGVVYTLPTGVTGPDGREFLHWTIDGNIVTNIASGTKGSKTVKAVYKNATYNITWDLTDGTTGDEGTWAFGIVGEATYAYGTGLASFRDNVTPPSGRTFDHWEIGGTKVTEIKATDFGDKTIKAVYTKNTYNIAWDLRDGNTSDEGTWNEGVIASTSYTYGTAYTFPTGVTGPSGRTFSHWEISGVRATEISASETGDKTIKAVYTKNTYNITWDLRDGTTSDEGTWSGTAGEATYTYGTAYSLPTGVTGPTGRTFDHWEIGGVIATEISASATGDKAIKAVYTNNAYNITWDLKDGTTSDEGTWSGTTGDATYTYGTAYTLPTEVTGPNGRTFDHWEIGGVRATEISASETGDKTIKAVYTKNTYNITWELTDGTTSDEGTWNVGVIASTSYTYGTAYTLPRGVTGPSGRTFDHWVIGSTTVTEIKDTDYGDKTIKAVYTKNTYNITWDLKDGNTNDEGTWAYGIVGDSTYTYGTGLASFRDNVTAPNGRTFSHWEIAGVRATEISATDFGNKIVKAVYTKNTYDIAWDLKDGNTSDEGTWSGATGEATYTYGTAYSLPTGVTGPNGRTFDHWEIGGATATSISNTDYGNKTVKAVYTKNTYNISWDLFDGVTSNTGSWGEGGAGAASYEYGSEYILPTNVNGPNGKLFIRWAINGTTVTKISNTDFGDKTIKAVYENEEYNITYDLEDGDTGNMGTWTHNLPGQAKYTYGTAYLLPVNVTGPTGRAFDHWKVNGVDTEQISGTSTGDVVVKAVYKNERYNISWDLKDTDGKNGSWGAVTGALTYEYSVEYVLPTDVDGPTGRMLDYWTVNGERATSIVAGSIGDKAVKAIYKYKEYKVQFKAKTAKGSDGNDYGNNADKAEATYDYSGKITMPNASDFAIEGFELIGFAKSSGAIAATWLVNTEYDIKDMSLNETGTNNIYPVYKELEVTIDFEGGSSKDSNGVTYDVSYVNKGNKYNYYGNVTFPTNINNTGFKLIGFNNEAGQTTANIDAGVALSVKTLIDEGKISATEINECYAVWKEREYKVEFVGGSKIANGRIINSEDKIAAETYKYYGSIVMPKESDMQLIGFKLAGFSKEDRQSAYKYQVEETVNVKNLITYASMKEDDGTDASINTLYGVWEKEKISITLEAVNGTFASGERTKVINVIEAGLALKDYEGYEEPEAMDGYAFDYWADESDNEVAKDTLVTGNIKLKAIYKMSDDDASKTKYVIDIVNDDTKGTYTGSATFEIALNDYVADTLTKSNIVDPTANSDWTFVGWSWVDDDISRLIKDTDKYTDTKNTTLYAVYKKVGNIYVTLEAGTGMFASTEKRTKVLVSNKETVLKDFVGYEIPVKEDYEFVKWIDEDIENDSESIIAADTTLRAVYGKKQESEVIVDDQNKKYVIKVENDTDKGTYTGATSFEIEIGNNVYDVISALGITNPTANAGWTFEGWSYNTSDVKQLINSTDVYNNVDNVKIVAVYTETGSFKVKLDAVTGKFESNKSRTKVITSKEAKALNLIDDYEEPIREGYKFVRWLDGDQKVTGTTVISSDITLVAEYISDESVEGVYSVSIVNNDTTKGIIKINDKESTNAKFGIKKGDDVLSTLANSGISVEAKDGYKFEGWSWTGEIYNLVRAGELYEDSSKTRLTPIYSEEGKITITLMANTGVFASNDSRVLNIVASDAAALSSIEGYEKPFKSGGYTFAGWINDETNAAVSETATFDKNTILKATYRDSKGNVIGDKGTGTEEGGPYAIYTILVKNEIRKGSMQNAVREDGSKYETATLELKVGDNIMNAINDKALTVISNTGYVYEGWSFSNDITDLITASDKYKDKSDAVINAMYYSALDVKVTLNANTGLFNNDKRTITLTSINKAVLNEMTGYEEPYKSDGWTFERWEKANGVIVEATDIMSESGTVVELFAIWKSPSGVETGNTDSTKDGGEDAIYTVELYTDATKGTLGSVKTFEVKKGELVTKVMTDAGIVAPTASAQWNFSGWSFTDNISYLIDDTTTYTDTTKTKLYAKYYEKNVFTVILNANTGLFDDNTIQKTLKSEEAIQLGKFTQYGVPRKSDKYTFNGWVDETGVIYPETKVIDSTTPVILYATYKDSEGNVIGGKGTGSEEGGANAVYTVVLQSDSTKGEIGTVKSFDIKKGENILSVMNTAGIIKPIPKESYFFVGWSFDDFANTITDSTVYDNENNRTLNALYTNEVFTVTLNANTGKFIDGSREKELVVVAGTLLVGVIGYEEPAKGAGFTFNRWKKDGLAIQNIDRFVVDSDMELFAVYHDDKGRDVGNDDDTALDGDNASYTIYVINDDSFGTYSGASSFEIKKNENVMNVMKKAGITEAIGNDDYIFAGWSLNGEKLIDNTTKYNNIRWTTLVMTYRAKSYKSSMTFDSWAGNFADGSKVKVYNDISAGRIINTLDGYEEPTREGWKFSRWVDTNNQVVEATSEVRSGVVTLIAKYIDENGNEIGNGDHSHYVCGALDSCVHTDGILKIHSYGSSYKAVSKGEEIVGYVNNELAKSEADRKNVYVYLLNDIDITENIELDKNVKLYICLNGFNLNTKKILAKDSATNAEVIISNCKDVDVTVTEIDSADDRPMFGTNGIHIFGKNNTLTLKAKGVLVNTRAGSSAVEKEIELQKVNVVGGNVTNDNNFISIEGNSNIKLVDVNIKDVNTKGGVIIRATANASLLIGNEVSIRNSTSNKAIIDDDGVFNVVNNAKLSVTENTIIKVANGVNGIILLGNTNNYVSGDLEVSNNKLILSDSYYNTVTGKETPGLLGGVLKGLFGVFAEEESPAGDVGYTAAIGFKNTNTNIEVKNSKIVVNNNESADNTDVKAGYMYNILSNDTANPVFTQVKGTVLNSESNIGVAFNTAEGEGIITNSKEVDSKIFKNTTYGIEEKIVGVKNTSTGIGIERKTYVIEYDEGKPTTEEKGTVIQTYNKDGSITSENTRIRTGAIKAGQDVKLEDDTIYTAKGFNFATYSIVRPSNKEKEMLLPKATISYINDIFDAEDDIEDGEVIRAVATWKEKELKSEGKDVVISKDDYEHIVQEAVTDVESTIASYSETNQVEIETEDKYYTVRYWLDGGNFEGSTIPESGYVEDTKAIRANKYVLVQDVEKIATVSGIVKSYDFIGWSIKDGDSTIIEEIEAGVENDIVEIVANYKPSTYKITYHLNEGKIKGSTDDLVDTVVRTEKYILFKNVEKNGFAFAGWTKANAEISASNPVITVLEAESLEADIDVYAQYTSTTYTVRYHLDGGTIEGVEVVDDVYEDNTADSTKDYRFIEDVTKPGFEFLGWVTVAGNVTIDTIKAGDTNESLREVIAKYRATTFTVNYDVDGGTIIGVTSTTVTPVAGKPYKLYTNVEKEGFEFIGWYDITTDQKITTIEYSEIGEVYNVKAKYIKPTYNLTLHYSASMVDSVTIKNISSKTEYVLPTNIKYSSKEFRDWYYVKDGYNISISSIKAGNPENITDVYARFDDLFVHTVNYYVRNDSYETEIMTPRDSEMVGRDVEVNGVKYKVYTTKVNKREDYVLETNVTKRYDYAEMEFLGWTLGRKYLDNLLGSRNAVEKVKQGISKEDELNGVTASVVYDYFAYFATKPTSTIKFKYVLNGGKLIGKTAGTEAEYIEHVNVKNTYTIDQNVVKDGFRFAGWFGNEELTDGPKFNYTPGELAVDKEFIPLYAKWDKITYSLQYYVDGGTMPGKILSNDNTVYKTEFTNTDDIVLDTNITKEGWTFAGWYDGEGEDAVKVDKVSKGTNQNVKVYARWIKDTYVVTYVLKGGKIEGVTEDTYKVTYDRKNTTTLITDIEKYGHKFLGWYNKEEGGEKVETIAKSDKAIDDTTVYAEWEDVRYTVKFILDGGGIKGKKLDEEGNYEEVFDGRKEVTLYDGTKVSRGDDRFIEWKDAEGKVWTTIPANNKENLVLTASYKLAMVDLVYHFDGGLLPGLTTEEDTSYTVKYNSTKDYTLISDVEWKTRIAGKQMYKFDGWQTKDGKPVTMIPKDSEEIKEVYATWVYAAYQIVYHVNGGEIFGLYVDMLGYSYAGGNMWTEKKLATNVTKEGSEFAGWYLDEEFGGGQVTVIPTLPTFVKNGFIHVNAKWVQEKYAVTYNAGEGSFKGVDTSGNTIKMSVENKFPYVLLDEENVTYAGHKFDGWYKKDESGEFVGEEVVWVDANNKESINLYAKYVAEGSDDEAYQARKNNRAAKKEEGTKKKNQMIAKAIEEAGKNTKRDMSATSDEFYNLLVKTCVDEDNSSAARETRESREARETTNKTLFGSIIGAVTSLFGDDDADPLSDDEPAPAGDVVTVNTASLKAYTTISAENFGGSSKDGFVCDSFIVTYIYDSDGNEIKDDKFVGRVYKAGDTLVDIAETYPNHTVGGRMVFIDTTLVGASEPDPTPSSDPVTDPTPSPSPSPSPSYSPSNSGSGNGNRGGGGGGAGGGGRKPAATVPKQDKTINLIVQASIPANDGQWIYNEFGQRVGYKIKTTSAFAQGMMKTEELKNNYISVDGGANIQLRGGFYNISYANGNYFFGFDSNGAMLKGFVNTADGSKVYGYDASQGKLVHQGNKSTNKYYLLENDNVYEGILYTLPIVVNNVSYTFNDEGAVISELTMGDASQGQWERDSSNGKWKCYSLDASGAKRYFINGIFDIKAQDNTTYKYIFDENGYMRTGLVQYQGKTYYCVENGDLQGTVVTGATNINGMTYLFDNNGVLVTPDAQNANAGVVQLSAMEQLQAFMNAMQQMQQNYVSAMQLLPTPDPVVVGNNIGNMFNTANNIQMLDASKKVVDNIKLATKEAEENGATTAVGVCLYLLNKAIGFFGA